MVVVNNQVVTYIKPKEHNLVPVGKLKFLWGVGGGGGTKKGTVHFRLGPIGFGYVRAYS